MEEHKQTFLLECIADHLALGRSFSEISRKLRAIATDREIQDAMEAFITVSGAVKAARQVNILLNDRDFESWYQGPSEDPTSHWNLLTEVLKNKQTRPWEDKRY